MWKFLKIPHNKQLKSVAEFKYLLTPWSRVLLDKLTINLAASQEIPCIYGTQKFLAVPTRARHLFLS
jgi:hypothetical protein